MHAGRMRSLLFLALMCGTASAHIEMTSPAPRTMDNKVGPCGAAGSRRGTQVARYAPGATVMVEWDETVDHPGHYRIAFDNDGDDVFVNPNNPDDNYPFTLMEPIADKVGGHYAQAITLPTTPCESCTLQVMQIMTVEVPYNSFYYQCADIAIGDAPDPGMTEDPPGDAGEVGGGCSAGGGAGTGALLALAGLVMSRRRR